MTEWTVVTVIVTLVGLGVAVVKPLISLNSTITRLVHIVADLEERLRKVEDKGSDARGRIWDEVKEHDDKLQDHETRITVLEHKEGT